YLKRMEQLIGIDMKRATWKKHENAYLNLKGYIKSNHKGKDFKLQDIDLPFIKDYEFYLKTNRRFSQATINKVLQRLKKMFSFAIEQNEILQSPFNGYRLNLLKKEVVYLTTEELKALEESKPTQPRLMLVKDLFVFCCYTGLAFNEMANLKHSNIEKGFDGKLWISLIREKTNKSVSIPILPKANSILNQYSTESDLVFAQLSNQKLIPDLKESAGIVGIEKNLARHGARTTSAGPVLLCNAVPIDIVSELLGRPS